MSGCICILGRGEAFGGMTGLPERHSPNASHLPQMHPFTPHGFDALPTLSNNACTLNARLRLIVTGVVQGVGFRPFVFGLAQRCGLAGFVGNNSAGAFIEIEGATEALAQFQHELIAHPPPLAHIESVQVLAVPTQGSIDFHIVESEAQSGANTLISPDISICDDCLRELLDPHNRRYRYPFINCTHCGPRFTIIKDIPYDRPFTTMAAFPLCADCEHEYHDPYDRRFHAQPIACPVCGPQVWLQKASDSEPIAARDDAVRAAQLALRDGFIVAVKGIGGFHLACDATNASAVQRLRERKGRGGKPFAVMVRDLDVARAFVEVNEAEAALLTSRERPIVILRRKRNTTHSLADAITPGNPALGILLPYSPLHYLLLEDMPALVMTSGNLSDEPIAKDNDEAMITLADIADVFLLHNRDIQVPCDDSVVRVFEGHELPVRRSRGYAPFPVQLPAAQASVLATGGELKAALCLTRDDHAFMSQHIGDMANLETLAAFDAARDHLQRLFRIEPKIIACDKHPGYLSTDWARRFAAQHRLPLVQVQHHHAHIAAVMAEHRLDGAQPVIGVCFDGTGFGDDGAIWGGEIFVADYKDYRRISHLAYVPLPGGDTAIKKPYRMALAHVWAAGLAWDEALPCVAACSTNERRVLAQQLRTNVNCVPTSSMGRLFDAAASLMGVQQFATYEAQAAIEMEALADEAVQAAYAFELDANLLIDPAPVLQAIVADVSAGVAASVMAAKFHQAVADVVLRLCLHLRESEQLNTVALSGGVFQNVLLLRHTVERLRTQHFDVLIHKRVPPNDGGLALGQAAVAAHA